MNPMHEDIERIIVDESKLEEIVTATAKQITEEYAEDNPLILCILKGGAPFAMNLFTKIDCPAEMDFLQVSSYGSGVTSNGFTWKKDVDCDLNGRHVILVDDILDSGNTLFNLKKALRERNPASLRLCVLFNKKERREAPIEADYIGMEVPDAFLVGYGLDYAEKYRNLPYVGVLKPEIYEGK